MKRVHRQRGATLFIGLVMLVILTLFALSAFQTSSTNLKTTGNMQSREEAQNAAQLVIDQVISSANFATDPANAILNKCGANNIACVDLLTGKGMVTTTADYTVRLNPAPTCIRIATILNSELNLDNVGELACAAGQPQLWGIAGLDTAASNSLCVNTIWDVTAEATSTNGTKVTVSQGVSVKAAKVDVSPFCI
jgi:Tfp pilus assembly protein PilX